jgi:hypothetical protein
MHAIIISLISYLGIDITLSWPQESNLGSIYAFDVDMQPMLIARVGLLPCLILRPIYICYLPLHPLAFRPCFAFVILSHTSMIIVSGIAGSYFTFVQVLYILSRPRESLIPLYVSL